MQEIVFLEPNNSIWKSIVLALNIGFDIFGILIISVFIGLFADYYLGLKPVGIIAGSLLGIAGCFKKILEIGGKQCKTKK